VLLTRATGHGKTTTLAVMIDKINQKRDAHAVTVKGPVGFPVAALQGIVVSRNLRTITAALTAAETEHLVFGTRHTNSARQSIDRLIDASPAAQQGQTLVQLANVLSAIVTQQLLTHKMATGWP